MYPYEVLELAWAISREREEEARLTRPHTEKGRKPGDPQQDQLPLVNPES